MTTPDTPATAIAAPTAQQKNKRTMVHLLLLVAASILFTIALIPLYNLVCQALGIGSYANPQISEQSAALAVEKIKASMSPADYEKSIARDIRIIFADVVMDGLPWEVRPLEESVMVKPAKTYTATYRVTNKSDKEITGQAIPSFTPPQAAPFFHKIACFCFNLQTLKPGESKDMSVVYTVMPDLPEEVAIITLNYRFIVLENKGQ